MDFRSVGSNRTVGAAAKLVSAAPSRHYGQIGQMNRDVSGVARCLRERHECRARSLRVYGERGDLTCKCTVCTALSAASAKRWRLRRWGSSQPIDRSRMRDWPKTRPERRAMGRGRPALRAGNKPCQT